MHPRPRLGSGEPGQQAAGVGLVHLVQRVLLSGQPLCKGHNAQQKPHNGALHEYKEVGRGGLRTEDRASVQKREGSMGGACAGDV